MATDLERLVVTLEARTKEYERALARAQNTTVRQMKAIERTVEQSAGRMEQRLTGVARGLSRGLAAAVGGLSGGAIVKAIGQVGALGEAAQSAGTDVEKLQELIFAGVGVGVDQAAIVQAMGKFNDELAEGATRGNELSRLLDGYGIKITDSTGRYRDTLDVLKDVADAIKNARSEQERALLITAALGDRIGRQFLPLLVQGSAELTKTMQRAREVGAVIDADLVAAADRFDDKLSEWVHTLGVRFKSTLVDIVEAFNRIGKATDELTLGELEREAERLRTRLTDALTQPFEGGDVVAQQIQQRLREIAAQMDAIRSKGPLIPPQSAGSGNFRQQSFNAPGDRGGTVPVTIHSRPVLPTR